MREPPEDALHSRDRAQGILGADRLVLSRPGLDAVLRSIVETACELVDAPYGALGVVDPSGTGLEAFVHVGVDDETVERIGHLPEGRGLLGEVIESQRPIRLADLRRHEDSVGFPEGHPPMKAFLGVPVPVHGTVYGNLYLARPDAREFTSQDEELLSALASTAGLAIQSARHFEEARSRQEWLQASTDITRALLTESGEKMLGEIARQVARLAEADIVTVVLAPPGADKLRIEVAEGRDAAPLEGWYYPMAGTISELVLRTGRTTRIKDASEARHGAIALADKVDIGPVMVLPLVGPSRLRGTLVVGRAPGHPPFGEAESEMAATFANQAALAIELANARTEEQRMLLLEDRERIARDLHDHVIQQLFGAGLAVQGVAELIEDDRVALRLEGAVAGLDDAIRQIRESIFELRASHSAGLRSTVLALVDDVRRSLALDPKIRFTGPVDSVTDGRLAGDVDAVVREALTNVARHADCTAVELSVEASADRLTVTIRDDGSGMGGSTRRSGLRNMSRRAARRGGTLTTGVGIGGRGVAVCWSVPIT